MTEESCVYVYTEIQDDEPRAVLAFESPEGDFSADFDLEGVDELITRLMEAQKDMAGGGSA